MSEVKDYKYMDINFYKNVKEVLEWAKKSLSKYPKRDASCLLADR
ncbi:MAG: hypothetical protein SPL00_04405 [Bacilli bacterium]|nr:hypothetical protein [Bacilli bacterium]